MDQISIKEDQISRKWQSSAYLNDGIGFVRKFGCFYVGAIVVVVIFLYPLNIPKKLWVSSLLFPTLPPFAAIITAMIHTFRNTHILIYSVISIIAIVVLLIIFKIPKKLWIALLIFPSFPILFALILILFHPILTLPQSWFLNNKHIQGLGFRFIGRIAWNSVQKWSVKPMQGLNDYFCLQFKWKKMFGIVGGTDSILIPPSISIEEAMKYFEDNCPVGAPIKRKIE